MELRASCGFQIPPARRLQLIGGETGKTTGINAAEEMGKLREGRVLWMDWMEGEN